MTKISIKKLIIFGTILIFTGFTAYAFAHSGKYHMGGGYGSGMMNGYHMGGGGHMWDDLSVKDQQKMHDQMNEFFSSTQELRKQYYQKRVELNQEYSKSEKDQAQIDTLEKELFDLSSQIEKSRFEHMNETQKLYSDKAPGYNMGRGGYGGCF